MNEQLSLDGVEPAQMKRTRISRVQPHLPTVKDAEALRQWIRDETADKGSLQKRIAAAGIVDPGKVFEALGKEKARSVLSASERHRLLALADKWERDANERKHG